MKQIWKTFGRVLLSLMALTLLATLFSISPFIKPTVESDSRSTDAVNRGTGDRGTGDRGTGNRGTVGNAGTSIGESVFRLGDWSLETRETTVTPCRAETWDLSSLDLCTGDCEELNIERDAESAKFSWLEAGGLHNLSLECEADGSRGKASHFTIPFETNPGHPGGVPVDREQTVPLLPGATELFRYGSGPLKIFVDRPRLTATALEELELELLARGWHPMAIPSFLTLPAFSASKVFLRGREFCVAALQLDSTDDLLISAYGHEGNPPETSR